MKKIVFALLSSLVLLSCSKDENDILPTNGQYVAYAEALVVSIVLDNGQCIDFDLYARGERFDYNQPAAISTKGEYPKYTYYINDLSVAVQFSDVSNFSAILDGELRYEKESDGLMSGGVFVFEHGTPILFMLDSTVLDANGDGLLDSK